MVGEVVDLTSKSNRIKKRIFDFRRRGKIGKSSFLGELVGVGDSEKEVAAHLGKGLRVGVVWDLRVKVLGDEEGVVRVSFGGSGGAFDF